MRLFKYCDEKAVDIFQNKRLLVKPACELNDPFEFVGCPDPELTRETILKEIKFNDVQDSFHASLPQADKPPRHRILNWFNKDQDKNIQILQSGYRNSIQSDVDKYIQELSKKYGVISLTRRLNSMLMWSHYTNGHKGFVVEFDLEQPPLSDAEGSYKENIISVRYSSDLVKIPASLSVNDDFRNRIFKEMLRTKYAEWKYEKEYRLRVVLPSGDESHKKSPPKSSYVDLPPTAIKQIVMGCRMERSVKDTIKSYHDMKEFKHIVLKEAQISKTKYKLNYRVVG